MLARSDELIYCGRRKGMGDFPTNRRLYSCTPLTIWNYCLHPGNIAALEDQSELHQLIQLSISKAYATLIHAIANYRCHSIRENLTADEMLIDVVLGELRFKSRWSSPWQSRSIALQPVPELSWWTPGPHEVDFGYWLVTTRVWWRFTKLQPMRKQQIWARSEENSEESKAQRIGSSDEYKTVRVRNISPFETAASSAPTNISACHKIRYQCLS